ncbi:MAG: UDP-N-acetylglucosamine--N-acetylmuramyl-(pentapeptide) pyrophosphoryl-undecaprenol N-acetylglucosamine transferase, partial [Gemmatimonadetes bacterium]|nr:UDP-N-acetylglucosamine--N-acetylmuramyl-(pentapeptide) pyrophosphoryl-undecaprenol N-acetylglucosamine transferase [Gemmatimonadota bacterium]
AGAMTTEEFLNQGLPAVLVPLPTAAENHQMFNARALEAAGTARVLPESELTPARLAAEVRALASDPDGLAGMRSRALARARPGATRKIAEDVATFLPVRRAA